MITNVPNYSLFNYLTKKLHFLGYRSTKSTIAITLSLLFLFYLITKLV